jgi:hypothetical protein
MYSEKKISYIHYFSWKTAQPFSRKTTNILPNSKMAAVEEMYGGASNED